MFLIIDNYDSFVYNLVRYFQELGEQIEVYRNDNISIEKIAEIKPEGIIISPGPKTPEFAGNSVDIIKAFEELVPILGICLGHQTIGYAYGAKIIKGIQPNHGKISKIYHNGEGIYEGLNNPFNATRYHSLVIDEQSIPDELEITSKTNDGTIMGIHHKNYKIIGVQFHPEAVLTECGYDLLKNFIKLCRKSVKE